MSRFALFVFSDEENGLPQFAVIPVTSFKHAAKAGGDNLVVYEDGQEYSGKVQVVGSKVYCEKESKKIGRPAQKALTSSSSTTAATKAAGHAPKKKPRRSNFMTPLVGRSVLSESEDDEEDERALLSQSPPLLHRPPAMHRPLALAPADSLPATVDDIRKMFAEHEERTKKMLAEHKQEVVLAVRDTMRFLVVEVGETKRTAQALMEKVQKSCASMEKAIENLPQTSTKRNNFNFISLEEVTMLRANFPKPNSFCRQLESRLYAGDDDRHELIQKRMDVRKLQFLNEKLESYFPPSSKEQSEAQWGEAKRVINNYAERQKRKEKGEGVTRSPLTAISQERGDPSPYRRHRSVHSERDEEDDEMQGRHLDEERDENEPPLHNYYANHTENDSSFNVFDDIE